MFRLALAFVVLPTLAAADWSPRPTMFSYDATFDRCTADPDASDLASVCADALDNAYVLKRAVARAAFACQGQDLERCAEPFETEGLPAIAVRIAVGSGCDTTDVSLHDDFDTLAPDHCVSLASAIMLDEGVVPLDTSISCQDDRDECGYLSFVHVSFWIDRTLALVEADPNHRDYLKSIIVDCDVQKFFPLSELFTRHSVDCVSKRSADLWSSASLENEQDN